MVYINHIYSATRRLKKKNKHPYWEKKKRKKEEEIKKKQGFYINLFKTKWERGGWEGREKNLKGKPEKLSPDLSIFTFKFSFSNLISPKLLLILSNKIT